MKVLLVSEGDHELSGALEALVRRIAPGDYTCESDCVRNGPRVHGGRHGRRNGYQRKALSWLLVAQDRGYDALVLVIDQDDDTSRHRQFDAAQESTAVGIDRALGVAVREFDAWMLADEKALSIALGKPVATQSNPEHNKDPKSTCASLIEQCEVDAAPSAVYADIAMHARPDVLASRCRKGYAPFADRLRRTRLASANAD